MIRRPSGPVPCLVPIGGSDERREYLHWHDGVEFDEATQTWRGYIEDNNFRSNKHLTEQTFDDKGDAIVAASKMLSEARKGRPPA